jgi:hypothetical protein
MITSLTERVSKPILLLDGSIRDETFYRRRMYFCGIRFYRDVDVGKIEFNPEINIEGPKTRKNKSDLRVKGFIKEVDKTK